MSVSVTKDVVEILQQELQEMSERLLEMPAPSLPALAHALDDYTVKLERFAEVTRALDLPGLRQVALLARDNVVRWARFEAPVSPRVTKLLAQWPLEVSRYLSKLGRATAERDLVAFMQQGQWLQPLVLEDTEALATTLAAPRVAQEPVPPVPREISVEDLSLEIPADVSPTLVAALLQELPELTERLATLIDEWADGQGSAAELREAQRVAHTIKGAANTVGVRGIATFTHSFEDLLNLLAESARPVSTVETHTLRRAAECLLKMSDMLLGRGESPGEVVELLQQISAHLHGHGETVTSDKPGVREIEPQPLSSIPDSPTPPSATPPSRAMTPSLRVAPALIDEIFRLAGESAIAVTQMRDRLQRVRQVERAIEDQWEAVRRLALQFDQWLTETANAWHGRLSSNESRTGQPVDIDRYRDPGLARHRLQEAISDAQELRRDMQKLVGELEDFLVGHERLQAEQRDKIKRCRMLPAGEIAPRLQRGVKQAAGLTGKDIELQIFGANTLIDSHILNAIVEPLMHALRNAIDHGIETSAERITLGKPVRGKLTLTFRHEGSDVTVRCEDDGRGLDYDAIHRRALANGLVAPHEELTQEQLGRLILQPGFSTRSKTTQTSGRGIGMSAIAEQIAALKGSLQIASRPHEGCRIEFRLPDSLFSMSGVIVPVEGQPLAVAGRGLERIALIETDKVREDNGIRSYDLGGRIYPMRMLTEVLYGRLAPPTVSLPNKAAALVVNDADVHCIVLIDEILATRTLIVKSPGVYLDCVRGLLGTTVLGDGRVVPVLDLPELLRHPARWRPAITQPVTARTATPRPPSVLIVDNSLSARRLLREALEAAGYTTAEASDGTDALSQLHERPDALLIDYDMPRMDGLELIARLRADPNYKHLPIIMITAQAKVGHREQVLGAGANGFLVKPCSTELLLEQLSTLLGNRRPSFAHASAAADSLE